MFKHVVYGVTLFLLVVTCSSQQLAAQGSAAGAG
jgi:hypothetical protein